MKWLRCVSYLIVFAVLTGAGPGPRTVAQAPAAMVQSGDTGVFGLSQADWEASFSPLGEEDGYSVYQLNDGGSLYIGFDSAGITTYVEYELGQPLSFEDMEAFVLAELLPSDVESAGQYQDIMVGADRQRVTVHLYVSDAVTQFLPGYTGVVLVAYAQGGDSFSVSIA